MGMFDSIRNMWSSARDSFYRMIDIVPKEEMRVKGAIESRLRDSGATMEYAAQRALRKWLFKNSEAQPYLKGFAFSPNKTYTVKNISEVFVGLHQAVEKGQKIATPPSNPVELAKGVSKQVNLQSVAEVGQVAAAPALATASVDMNSVRASAGSFVNNTLAQAVVNDQKAQEEERELNSNLEKVKSASAQTTQEMIDRRSQELKELAKRHKAPAKKQTAPQAEIPAAEMVEQKSGGLSNSPKAEDQVNPQGVSMGVADTSMSGQAISLSTQVEDRVVEIDQAAIQPSVGERDNVVVQEAQSPKDAHAVGASDVLATASETVVVVDRDAEEARNHGAVARAVANIALFDQKKREIINLAIKSVCAEDVNIGGYAESIMGILPKWSSGKSMNVQLKDIDKVVKMQIARDEILRVSKDPANKTLKHRALTKWKQYNQDTQGLGDFIIAQKFGVVQEVEGRKKRVLDPVEDFKIASKFSELQKLHSQFSSPTRKNVMSETMEQAKIKLKIEVLKIFGYVDQRMDLSKLAYEDLQQIWSSMEASWKKVVNNAKFTGHDIESAIEHNTSDCMGAGKTTFLTSVKAIKTDFDLNAKRNLLERVLMICYGLDDVGVHKNWDKLKQLFQEGAPDIVKKINALQNDEIGVGSVSIIREVREVGFRAKMGALRLASLASATAQSIREELSQEIDQAGQDSSGVLTELSGMVGKAANRVATIRKDMDGKLEDAPLQFDQAYYKAADEAAKVLDTGNKVAKETSRRVAGLVRGFIGGETRDANADASLTPSFSPTNKPQHDSKKSGRSN